MFGSRPARPRTDDGSRARGAVAGRGRDEAVAQVLEAVVIGVVILGATFFAVSFQAPPSPEQNPGTEQTEEATYGALNSLNDLYIDDARYNHSALSKALAEAAAGNKTPLVESIEAFLPPESRFCVHLNNGRDRIELHCPRDPPGAAVGTSYPIEPNWRFHYGQTDLRYVDQSGNMHLGVNEIPIMNAHTVRDQGSYVNVSITGEQAWRPGLDTSSALSTFRDTAYTTLLQGDDDADYPSASVFMQCERSDGSHEPCYASDLTGGMTGYAPYEENGQSDTIRFTVENAGPGSVPAGAQLEIDFPVGLDVARPVDGGSAFTNVTVQGEDSSAAESVRAELDDELGVGSVDLDVEVNSTDTRYAYKHVDARLSDGAVSSSQLLLRVENKTTGDRTGGDDRRVMISTPKPAGSAENGNPSGRWGVVLPLPYARTSLDDLSFSMAQGEDVLTSVDWPDDFNPPPATQAFEARSVRNGTIHDGTADEFMWSITPPLDYRGYSFAEFQFNVTTDGTQTRASERFPFAQPEANFDSYDPPPQSIQMEPGIWWRAYPPEEGGSECGGTSEACPGYDNSANLSKDVTTEERAFATTLDWRDVRLGGEANYTLADIKDPERQGMKDALRATKIATDPGRVAPGETTTIHIDAQDLAHYVAETSSITDMKLESDIYAPWGIPNGTPVETIDHGRVAGGGVEAPNDLLPLYVDGDNVEDVVTASTDGNVYGVHGDSGQVVAGAVFGLPEGSGANPATPNVLSHGTDPGGEDIIAIGTKAGIPTFYTIDGDFEERWKATKPDNNTETRAIHVGSDLTDDGYPEIVLATNAQNASDTSAYEQSRLTVWEGRDTDGDGEGDLVDGWGWDYPRDYGVVVNGEPSQMGMARLGVEGKPGIWTDTGPKVGTNVLYVANQTEQAIMDGDYTGAATQAQNTTIRQEGSGLYGFSKDGNELLNLSGIRVVKADTVEQITDGSKHSGIAVGGANGWAWGLNGSAANYPVTGQAVVPIETRTDVSMGNKLDGYMVGRFVGESESYMQATSSAFTAKQTVWWEGEDMVAVDTPEGRYQSDETAISWWAGTKGGILRSTDRLETIENKGGVGAYLVGQVDPDEPTVPDLSLDGAENLQLSAVNFTDVHAVSADEAWFVGKGIPSTDLEGNGVILHTYDGGETYHAVEVACGNLTCNLHGIDHDGKRLWVVGDGGTVLTSNVSGMASQTYLAGDAAIRANGAVEIPIQANRNVKVDNVTVTWDPRTLVSYGEAATLANETSGDRDLWHKDKACADLQIDPYVEDGSCSEDWGYDHADILRVEAYLEDSNATVNRTLDGQGNLTIGPFTDGLNGYHDKEWYNDSSHLPLTYHVNVTFSDETRDSYTVHINGSGGINTTEGSMVNWTYPSELPNDESFSTPECFGQTTQGCANLKSINITNVGTADDPSYVGVAAANVTDNGTPLYRLAEGTRSWTAKSMPVATSFRDAAVSPATPDRWIAGDKDGRVVVSQDGGENWEPVPSAAGPVHDVDLTDPTIGHIVGGQGLGEHMVLNGFASSGIVETEDLYDGASSLEKISFSSLPTVDVDRGGDTPVEVQVWDEHADGGDGAWGTLYHSATGATVYNFTSDTKNVTLRFKLAVNGLKKWSPLVRGNMTFTGYTHDNLANADAVSFELDLTDPSKLGGEVEHLDYDPEHGYLRLTSVQNPWLLKLGNPHEGDWSTVRNGTVGARVADMHADPNGTIWIVTEGIYEHDAGMDSPTVQDFSCNNGSDCFDNTLYAINASTGRPASWWDPMHFRDPPQELSVGQDSLTVLTGNETDESKVFWMEFDDPRKDQNETFSNREETPKEMVTIDAWPSHTDGQDDPVASMTNPFRGKGALYGFRSPNLTENWRDMPALNDQFSITYTVPEDALYGSRIVVTQVRWQVTDEYGTELVQSGRLHDTFDVTPEGGPMPLVPTYTLEVVAWIEDWR